MGPATYCLLLFVTESQDLTGRPAVTQTPAVLPRCCYGATPSLQWLLGSIPTRWAISLGAFTSVSSAGPEVSEVDNPIFQSLSHHFKSFSHFLTSSYMYIGAQRYSQFRDKDKSPYNSPHEASRCSERRPFPCMMRSCQEIPQRRGALGVREREKIKFLRG